MIYYSMLIWGLQTHKKIYKSLEEWWKIHTFAKSKTFIYNYKPNNFII